MVEGSPKVYIDDLRLCETRRFDLVCDFRFVMKSLGFSPPPWIVGQGTRSLANLNYATSRERPAFPCDQ
jgi:hypothetical protein